MPVAYFTAAHIDLAERHPDAGQRRESLGLTELLTPVVKAWSTDIGVEMASVGVQVHGGMGFIEETGAAQHYRDARITPIYEGTNGIQALDLAGRKLTQDNGLHIRRPSRQHARHYCRTWFDAKRYAKTRGPPWFCRRKYLLRPRIGWSKRAMRVKRTIGPAVRPITCACSG